MRAKAVTKNSPEGKSKMKEFMGHNLKHVLPENFRIGANDFR